MIKGISEKRRLRRIGRIRLGEKKVSQNGKEYPVALDHFNFEDAPELEALYGKNCKEIDVKIPNENVDAFFPQERKCYRTSGLFCRGDGETATRVNVGLSDGDRNSKAVPKGQPLDPEGYKFIQSHGIKADTGDMFEMPCAGEHCQFTERKFCKPIGRFLFLIPNAPKIGVYEISTTSYNSIVELNSSIEVIKGIAGRISMIPLKLKLVPKDAKVPKSTMTKVIYHLVLEFNGSLEQLSNYRAVREIPLDQLPTRHELEQHVPEDLVPHGGAALDAELLGGSQKIAGPEDVPSEPMPPSPFDSPLVKQAIEAKLVDPIQFSVGGVTKKGELFTIIEAVTEKKRFTLDESAAKLAKKAKESGTQVRVLITKKDDQDWIDKIDLA